MIISNSTVGATFAVSLNYNSEIIERGHEIVINNGEAEILDEEYSLIKDIPYFQERISTGDYKIVPNKPNIGE